MAILLLLLRPPSLFFFSKIPSKPRLPWLPPATLLLLLLLRPAAAATQTLLLLDNHPFTTQPWLLFRRHLVVTISCCTSSLVRHGYSFISFIALNNSSSSPCRTTTGKQSRFCRFTTQPVAAATTAPRLANPPRILHCHSAMNDPRRASASVKLQCCYCFTAAWQRFLLLHVAMAAAAFFFSFASLLPWLHIPAVDGCPCCVLVSSPMLPSASFFSNDTNDHLLRWSVRGRLRRRVILVRYLFPGRFVFVRVHHSSDPVHICTLLA